MYLRTPILIQDYLPGLRVGHRLSWKKDVIRLWVARRETSEFSPVHQTDGPCSAPEANSDVES